MSEGKPQSEIDLELVRRHVDQLSEHFEAVQIFCTRYNPNAIKGHDEDGTTTRVNLGSGNFFARYGHVEYWLAEQKPSAKGSDSED